MAEASNRQSMANGFSSSLLMVSVCVRGGIPAETQGLTMIHLVSLAYAVVCL